MVTIDGIGDIENKSNPADDMAIDCIGYIGYNMYKALKMFVKDWKDDIWRLICNMKRVS
jgi:hypothetical protein